MYLFAPSRIMVALTALLVFSQTAVAGPPPPISYHLPLVDFARYANVIAEMDLAEARALYRDSLPIWKQARMTFIRGSKSDTTLDNNEWLWHWIQPADSATPAPEGDRIWVFLVPQEAVPYGVYHIWNAIQIIPAAEVPRFRSRLNELLSLDKQGDTTQLWHWVMRGLADPASSIHQDAQSTLSLSADTRLEAGSPYPRNPYQTPSKGLNISYFPTDQHLLLKQITMDSVRAHSHDPLPYSTLSLLTFSRLAGVTGLPELYLSHASGLLAWLDQLRTAYAPAEHQEYYLSSLVSDVANTGVLMAECPDVTRYELMRAARLSTFTQRWTAEYPALLGSSYYLPYDYAAQAELLSKATGQKISHFKQLERNLDRLYALPYDADHRPARERVCATIRIMTGEAGEWLGMCSDPEIAALTGSRNWWGCHKAEVKLETFVLNNAPSTADAAEKNIAIAPNPCKGRCTLEWKEESEATRALLVLTDATGKQVWTQKHELVRYAPVQQAFLEFPPHLAAGAYTLLVQYPDQQLQIRVLLE